MTARRDPQRRPTRGESSWLDEIERGGEAPDLTREIMGRLGYMKTPDAAARRRRRGRRVARTVIIAGGVAMLAMGAVIHHAGPRARQPVEQTIPAALSQDVQQKQERWQRSLETIIRPGPWTSEENPDAPAPEQIAMGPFRWL
jgi:hypothetical protein